jgi:signal transduction histidine kinase/CheY-like chemotaxis protein/HPt (histidine-containing phosphotransfer) domain-containing protein
MFFKIEYGSFTERYILYGLAWLNILAALLSFLLPVSGGLTQISLLYGAPFITFTILCLMAGAQSAGGNSAARYYFIGSLFPVIGLFIILLGFMRFVPHHPFLINSLWYSVALQGLFMVFATHKKLQSSPGAQTTLRMDSGDVDFSKLRETKDTADHSRLLKVIEKERELLAEFRARENERVDEMRKAKETADEANRAKSAFLAVVSHEIRTPMTGVMGMVRLLLDSSITKQQRDYVLTIQESSEAMMALLNDILDFERIQRGKIELENISFDLHRLIQGVITLMSGHAAEKGIALSARIDDDLPKFVKGDPTRLRQVLLNLMGNAIKFTEKGNVTLLVKNMDQSDEAKPSRPGAQDKFMIYFAVQDTGIGISAEQKKNLFTPFAQANSSITRKFGGTGLGLAISKGLIETMGSAININSKEGEGSTFFFTLDMARGIAANNEKPLPKQPEEKKQMLPLRILVVDDNAITRKVVAGFLEGGHHDILTADNAEEALKKINQDAFDLIFMDIELPGMPGNEATKILREHRDPVKAAIPVIAMTGNIAKEDKERYLSDGMSGFLPKPIEADQVRSMVEEIAHKSFEREIRMPQPSHDPFAQSPEEIAAHARKLEEIPHDKNIFNPDMLQSLKDTIGAKQLGELLTELIVKTEEILMAMDDATKQNDLVTLAARAHELKGMAGNFGLVEISAIAAQAERKAKTSDTADLGALVGTLPDANIRAQNALKEWSSY